MKRRCCQRDPLPASKVKTSSIASVAAFYDSAAFIGLRGGGDDGEEKRRCEECNLDKPKKSFHGKKCNTCCKRAYRKRQEGQTRYCATCCENKPAKSMMGKKCDACYRRGYRKPLEGQTRYCATCSQDKPVTSFHGEKCDTCYRRGYRKRLEGQTRYCATCHGNKPASTFHGKKCYDCTRNWYQKDYQKEYRKRLTGQTRYCVACRQNKPATAFNGLKCQPCYNKGLAERKWNMGEQERQKTHSRTQETLHGGIQDAPDAGLFQDQNYGSFESDLFGGTPEGTRGNLYGGIQGDPDAGLFQDQNRGGFHSNLFGSTPGGTQEDVHLGIQSNLCGGTGVDSWGDTWGNLRDGSQDDPFHGFSQSQDSGEAQLNPTDGFAQNEFNNADEGQRFCMFCEEFKSESSIFDDLACLDCWTRTQLEKFNSSAE